VRFAILNEIRDLFNYILNLRSVSKDEISIGAKKLADQFNDLNSAELTNQIESFKTFAFELEPFSNVFHMTKFLVVENNNLMTCFPG